VEARAHRDRHRGGLSHLPGEIESRTVDHVGNSITRQPHERSRLIPRGRERSQRT